MRVAALGLLLILMAPSAAAGGPSDAAALVYGLACEPQPSPEGCRLLGIALNTTARTLEEFPAYLTEEAAEDAVASAESLCADAALQDTSACEAMAGDAGVEDVRPCREPPGFGKDPGRYLLATLVQRTDERLATTMENSPLAKSPLAAAGVCRHQWDTLHAVALLV